MRSPNTASKSSPHSSQLEKSLPIATKTQHSYGEKKKDEPQKIMLMKETNHKRPYTGWLSLHKTSRINKSTGTKGDWGLPGAEGDLRNLEFLLSDIGLFSGWWICSKIDQGYTTCEYIKSHRMLHFKMVNFVICKLFFNFKKKWGQDDLSNQQGCSEHERKCPQGAKHSMAGSVYSVNKRSCYKAAKTLFWCENSLPGSASALLFLEGGRRPQAVTYSKNLTAKRQLCVLLWNLGLAKIIPVSSWQAS